MKTKFTIVLTALFLLVGICANAQVKNQTPKRAESETPIKGDVNGDGRVDVADIAAIIEIMKNNGGEVSKYTWYQGMASEEQIQSQEYVNSLTYNQLTKPESNTTITLSKGYNVFIFPESWGIPTFGTDTSYSKRDDPFTADELGIINPEGKIFIVVWNPSEGTRYIKW